MEQELQILKDVPLAPFTTLKIGGAARFFVRAETEEQVIAAFRYAAGNSLPLFILGGGSNVLISDDGFGGVVVRIAIPGISHPDAQPGAVLVTAGAGVDWDGFVEYCVGQGFQGVECLSGIPGSVGGTPVQNVGAYGQEVSETISAVRCFDRHTEKIVELTNFECGFSYRTSIFNTTEKDRYIVFSVSYALTPGGEPLIEYADLRNHFAGQRPSLAETRAAVLRIRAAKSMVIEENDPNSRSAGSFFKNPVVSVEELSEVEQRSRELKIIRTGENLPVFRLNEKFVKIPAAWLIEQAGFHKGFQRGRAGLSERHTLAVINRGGATAAEVIDLKNEIQEKVLEKFGLSLQPEPTFIGKF